jgi:uncharacterized RDD family membrane protein YckC
MEMKTPISWLGWIVSCLCALGAFAGVSVADVAPTPTSRDLLATEGGGRYWVARALQGTGELSRYTLTNIDNRVNFGQWTSSAPVLGRVVSIAGGDGELFVVLQNGQWQIVDDTGVRSGIPMPGDGMLAVADGQQTVWAIIQGERNLTTAPEIELGATTEPTGATTTGPATQPAADLAVASALSTTRTMPSPLFARSLSAGKWVNRTPIPPFVTEDPQQLSMTVVDGLPMIAWRASDSALHVIQLRHDKTWSTPIEIPAATGEDFKLMNVQGSPEIWLGSLIPTPPATAPSSAPSTGNWSAGELLTGPDFSHIQHLQIAGPRPPNIIAQTFLPALNRLRWLGTDSNGRIAEIVFDLKGVPVASFPVAEKKPDPTPIGPWAGASALMVVMSAAAATRTRQVPLIRPASPTDEAPPQMLLAPLRLRFAAGMVDLIPLLAVTALIRPGTATNPLSGLDVKSLQPLFTLAVLTYLLHITIAEIICGQSVGKMVFGLRVVTLQGKEPNWMNILVRNGLRIVDLTLLGLPLILIAVLPLHQRLGDLLAGTVVVASEDTEDEAK